MGFEGAHLAKSSYDFVFFSTAFVQHKPTSLFFSPVPFEGDGKGTQAAAQGLPVKDGHSSLQCAGVPGTDSAPRTWIFQVQVQTWQ